MADLNRWAKMKHGILAALLPFVSSAFAAEVQRLDPAIYLGGIENAKAVAQSKTVTAEEIVAWPVSDDLLEIRPSGDVRILSDGALTKIKELLASSPTVSKVGYACSPIARVRLTFSGASKTVELVLLLGHAFVVTDGRRMVDSGASHFPRANEVFEEALLSRYSKKELEALYQQPNQIPEPTSGSVTPRADARVAPPPPVAHR